MTHTSPEHTPHLDAALAAPINSPHLAAALQSMNAAIREAGARQLAPILETTRLAGERQAKAVLVRIGATVNTGAVGVSEVAMASLNNAACITAIAATLKPRLSLTFYPDTPETRAAVGRAIRSTADRATRNRGTKP